MSTNIRDEYQCDTCQSIFCPSAPLPEQPCLNVDCAGKMLPTGKTVDTSTWMTIPLPVSAAEWTGITQRLKESSAKHMEALRPRLAAIGLDTDEKILAATVEQIAALPGLDPELAKPLRGVLHEWIGLKNE